MEYLVACENWSVFLLSSPDDPFSVPDFAVHAFHLVIVEICPNLMCANMLGLVSSPVCEKFFVVSLWKFAAPSEMSVSVSCPQSLSPIGIVGECQPCTSYRPPLGRSRNLFDRPLRRRGTSCSPGLSEIVHLLSMCRRPEVLSCLGTSPSIPCTCSIHWQIVLWILGTN